MRVVGVIDLRDGRAVHARAGRRELYQPVERAAGAAIEGDAVALARSYVDGLGIGELYAADLDALAGRAPHDGLIPQIAALSRPLLLDAAVTSTDRARHALALGAARVVVALETLDSFDTLRRICDEAGGDRIAFSLDLRGGRPVVARSSSIPSDEAPRDIAARARDAGVRALIVIDLARVGTNSGLDLAQLAEVRDAVGELDLLAGGGVRGADDLARLAAAGCDGALVATALHDGRIGAAEIAAVATDSRDGLNAVPCRSGDR